MFTLKPTNMSIENFKKVTREEFDKVYNERYTGWNDTLLRMCEPAIRGYYPKELKTSHPDGWVAQINYGEDGKESEWYLKIDE